MGCKAFNVPGVTCLLLAIVLVSLRGIAAAGDAHFLEIHAVALKADATSKWYSFNFRGNPPEAVFLEPEVLLDETAVKSAWVEHDEEGAPSVRLKLTEPGAHRLEEITERLQPNRRMGIVVAGQLISAPVVRTKIPGGDAIISGAFTETEASDIATKLNQKISK